MILMSTDKKFSQADKAIARQTKKVEKELLKAYSESLKEIRILLAMSYEKYGSHGELSYSDMAKYNRLVTLEKHIIEEIKKLTGKNARTLKSGIAGAFEESFYRTAFTLETTVEARLGFGLLNERAIASAVNNPLSRITWQERHRDNQTALIKQLRQEITQGLIQGKSYQQIARSVKDRMEIGASKTQRIINTEAHRAMAEGRQKSLEHAQNKGVNMKKRWVSTLDGRTRDRHQGVDGQEVGIDEPFDVDGESLMYPGDLAGSAENVINCRCTHIAIIKGYEPEVRRAREIEGKRGEIISYTTYDKWKADRIK